MSFSGEKKIDSRLLEFISTLILTLSSFARNHMAFSAILNTKHVHLLVMGFQVCSNESYILWEIIRKLMEMS